MTEIAVSLYRRITVIAFLFAPRGLRQCVLPQPPAPVPAAFLAVPTQTHQCSLAGRIRTPSNTFRERARPFPWLCWPLCPLSWPGMLSSAWLDFLAPRGGSQHGFGSSSGLHKKYSSDTLIRVFIDMALLPRR